MVSCADRLTPAARVPRAGSPGQRGGSGSGGKPPADSRRQFGSPIAESSPSTGSGGARAVARKTKSRLSAASGGAAYDGASAGSGSGAAARDGGVAAAAARVGVRPLAAGERCEQLSAAPSRRLWEMLPVAQLRQAIGWLLRAFAR